ncbi:hypothetical protein CCR85_02220 [Rhodothalassium salexigens]|uniref:hypothetical protein n=1 Tax=Rhodothalassium salexigens TaxID=1086 RepID=UPI0019126E92|nr:hypothetical protein [Rhodothalassium salexigens]MBK5910305.1 hypothetical protein [Rhodothalassium salexigens]MBK5921082.1 hypothetical protein [Rhodothalassium salexigens]
MTDHRPGADTAKGATAAAPDVAALAQAWAARPGDRTAFWRWLGALTDTGDIAAVSDALAAYRRHRPLDDEILRFTARFLEHQGAGALALKFLKHALAEGGDRTATLTAMIRVARGQGDLDTAHEAFRHASAEGLADPDLLCEAAQLFRYHLSDRDRAMALLDQALSLDPAHAPALEAKAHDAAALRADPGEVRALYARALAAAPDDPALHLNHALYLIPRGWLSEGWAAYEHRLDPRRGPTRTAVYAHALPGWQGEPLAGKSVVVLPEQGIGDEVMFGHHLPRLAGEAARLAIGCDPRLVPAYARAFPDAWVEGFVDAMDGRHRRRRLPKLERAVAAGHWPVDHAIPAGSLSRLYWPDAAALPAWPTGYLGADPDLAARLERQLPPAGGRLRVGLSWRSGRVGRATTPAYIGVPGAARVMRAVGGEACQFVSLQYGADAAETDELARLSEVPLDVVQGVDLKQDIEANLALMAGMDLVVGPGIATQMLALAAGRPTWIVSAIPQLWQLGDRHERPAHIPGLRVFGRQSGSWRPVLDALGAALVAAAQAGDANAAPPSSSLSSSPSSAS